MGSDKMFAMLTIYSEHKLSRRHIQSGHHMVFFSSRNYTMSGSSKNNIIPIELLNDAYQSLKDTPVIRSPLIPLNKAVEGKKVSELL